MRSLEGAVELLRPFVEAKQWDYCVVWKLGDDPSRFIELMGCCCGGGYGGCGYVKEEEKSTQLCRDGFLKHPIRTKACEALAQLPSSMPLYSGIHTEVVISTQPRWITSHVGASDSNPSQSDGLIGTRVLIPVLSGLIELFATKHVQLNIPENQKMLKLFMDPLNISIKQEAMTTYHYANVSLNASASLDEIHLHPLPEEYPQTLLPPLSLENSIPRPQVFPPVSQSTSCPSLGGSSSGSNPSSEHSLLSSHSNRPKCGDHLFNQPAVMASDSCGEDEKHNKKVNRRKEGEHFRSKNLVAERNRRTRIKDGLFALRTLVPKISKMDFASIVGDAVDYIEELQKTKKKLKDELRELEEEEDFTKTKADVNSVASDMKTEGSNCLISRDHKQSSSNFVPKSSPTVEVEVNQIGKRSCLVKLLCERHQGGFARLMETMDFLGLQVVDANVTTFDRNALNILKVEANKDIHAKKLRDKLIQLTMETNQACS